MTFFRCAGLVLPLLVLAACSDAVPVACPDVGIIQDAARIVKFRDGPGRDPTDVVYEAEITKAHLDCHFDDESVVTDVVFQATARKGPAANSDSVLLPYFVAVVSTDEKKLVSKRQFEIEVPFKGASAVILSQEIPEDATVVPKPEHLMPGVTSQGGGPVGKTRNIVGDSLYIGQPGGGGGGGDKKPVRRPGTILPGVQGSVPYQVLLGFQLDKDQLLFNRDAQTY